MCRFNRIGKVLLGLLMWVSLFRCQGPLPPGLEAGRLPRLRPDYVGITIPPNIAPLRFVIDEPGKAYAVQISVEGSGQDPLFIRSRSPKIRIPMAAWRRLVRSNPGQILTLDIWVDRRDSGWVRYRPIHNRISKEPIDSHVVYRLINPGYVLWWEMGIYQRNLENFTEKAVFTNRVTRRNCMNCHAFWKNRPDRMLFHMRSHFGGTMLVTDGQVRKVDTTTPFTMSAGVYPAWHPDGSHVAFSVNKVFQNFHAHDDRNIYVWDKASDLIVVDLRTLTVTTSPKISTRRLENLPTFSPDGRYLYFCSAPEWKEGDPIDQIRYDLMRIAFDAETYTWGEVEKVLSAEETGKSISFPKVSPDGRYLLFCMSDDGYFTIHFPSSDLYVLDLTTRCYWPLEVNSPSSEGYHAWSSEGRWFVFASKRGDGIFTRLYFSYLDSLGHASKPFVLPQADPEWDDQRLWNYNVPELVKGPIGISRRTLLEAALRPPEKARFDSTVPIDALSGATRFKPDRRP